MTTLKEAMNDPDAIKRALEAAHKDQQAMKATPTNEDEELREKIANIVRDERNYGFAGTRPVNQLLALTESYANTKVAEVLDRLLEKRGILTDPLYDEKCVPISAIQAERAKLTQEEGSDE